MDRKKTRPLTLEESKLMFRLTMQTAGTGFLSHVRVRHLAAGAFLAGLTLGAVPRARAALGALLMRSLNKNL